MWPINKLGLLRLLPGRSFNLFIYLIKIDSATGAAAFGAAAFAAEAFINQPGHVNGRHNKKQEDDYLLNHDVLITLQN
jgi:hypothetical protein